MLFKPSLLLFFFFIVVNSQSYNDDQQQEGEGPSSQQRYQQEQDQQQENEGSLPGSNAVDVSVPEPPSQIPETSFSCDGKPYDPGMYADEETGCRVFHLCYQARKESFICGTGTMFNQEILSCDYPANVDCSGSASFYSANEELGKAGKPEPSGDGGQKPTQQRPQGGARGGGRDQVQTPQQQQGYDDQEPEQQQTRPAARPRPQAPRQQPRAQKPAPRARAPRPQAPRPAPASRGKTRPRPQIAQRQQEDEAY